MKCGFELWLGSVMRAILTGQQNNLIPLGLISLQNGLFEFPIWKLQKYLITYKILFYVAEQSRILTNMNTDFIGESVKTVALIPHFLCCMPKIFFARLLFLWNYFVLIFLSNTNTMLGNYKRWLVVIRTLAVCL